MSIVIRICLLLIYRLTWRLGYLPRSHSRGRRRNLRGRALLGPARSSGSVWHVSFWGLTRVFGEAYGGWVLMYGGKSNHGAI